jgi:hypothetical protein
MLPRVAAGCQGLSAILLAVSMLFSAACAHGGAGDAGKPAAEEQTGVIRRVGTFGYGIVPDRDPGTRYAPDRLAPEFEVDGLRVIFSGAETAPPSGARLWGTPFHLVSIRRAPGS